MLGVAEVNVNDLRMRAGENEQGGAKDGVVQPQDTESVEGGVRARRLRVSERAHTWKARVGECSRFERAHFVVAGEVVAYGYKVLGEASGVLCELSARTPFVCREGKLQGGQQQLDHDHGECTNHPHE